MAQGLPDYTGLSDEELEALFTDRRSNNPASLRRIREELKSRIVRKLLASVNVSVPTGRDGTSRMQPPLPSRTLSSPQQQVLPAKQPKSAPQSQGQSYVGLIVFSLMVVVFAFLGWWLAGALGWL
jgi:hypothetical protein